MLYFGIAFVSTVLGALSGLGGGILIKPLLDALSPLDPSVISVVSTATVFVMALTATVKYSIAHCHLWNRATVLLALGAALGGPVGTVLLDRSIRQFKTEAGVKLLQNSLLLLVLLLVACSVRGAQRHRCHLHAGALILLMGLCLGTLSAFLGIGGGPINVAALGLFFAMDLRQSSLSSMLLILCSQGTKLLSLGLTENVPPLLDGQILLLMLPAGIMGALIGAALNRRVHKRTLQRVYQGLLLFVMLTCLFNIANAIESMTKPSPPQTVLSTTQRELKLSIRM